MTTPPPSPGFADISRLLPYMMIGGFAVAFNIRVTDPLLPSLAAEFASTPGKVAIVSVTYAIAHGAMQFVGGPLGDRYGKLRIMTWAAFAAAFATAASALAVSIETLAALRFLAGATAAVIFPLALAYIGDTTPYAGRQLTAARLLGGAMVGTMLGQAIAGVFADYLGWRSVFVAVGVLFALSAGGLAFAGGLTQRVPARETSPGLLADFLAPLRLLGQREARFVAAIAIAEGGLTLGTTAFIGAYLHDEFNLSYTQIGLILALLGAGGVIYTVRASWLIPRLGERGLVTYGGFTFCLFYLLVALTPVWQLIPGCLFICGVALLMVHNTLQVRATQMAPEARGAALSLFAASFFGGQLVAVAIAGVLYDRFGGRPIFALAAVLFAGVVLVFRAYLKSAQPA